MNLYIKGRMNCIVSRGIKKLLMEIVAYVFTDIPFLDSHRLLKNGLKLLKDKALEIISRYGRTKAQSWP